MTDAQLRVFDTNIVSRYRRREPKIVARYDAVPIALRSVAVITVEERLSGWYDELRRENSDERISRAYLELAKTVQFYAHVRILPYDAAAIAHYKRLLGFKLNVAKFDLRIAAIAIAHDALVVTQNSRDFACTPDCTVESWDEEPA